MTQEDVQVVTAACGVITTCIVTVGAVIGGYIAYKQKALEATSKQAAADTKQVAKDLITHQEQTSVQLDSLSKKADINQVTTDETRQLVNGALESRLRAEAKALREVSTLKPSDISAKACADAAEKALSDHLTTKAEVKGNLLVSRPLTKGSTQ